MEKIKHTQYNLKIIAIQQRLKNKKKKNHKEGILIKNKFKNYFKKHI
jgi:hypothetical protein